MPAISAFILPTNPGVHYLMTIYERCNNLFFLILVAIVYLILYSLLD